MLPHRILHARYVFPVAGEPIANGFVGIRDGRIASVGTTPPRGEYLDLGNVALLPGLVNSHTHLELSGLSEPLGTQGMGFVDWIRKVLEWRGGQRMDPIMTIACGLLECAKEGVTCIGNISQIAEPDNAYENAAVEVKRFLEVISPKFDEIPPVVNSFPKLFQKKEASKSRSLGLSPHAPYSVHPSVLQIIIETSTNCNIPLAMHLAESREEMELLREGTGPFREFLAERDLFDPAIFPGGKRPLDYLKMLVEAHRALIVHGNYLDDEEIAFLADCSAKMAVVYCPRTHAFFGHEPYRLEKMLAAGVTVALGTDSRASSPDLSLLAEMRFAAKHHPQIGRERILRMGTIDAARALGRAEDIGSIEPGKAANFTVVALGEEDSKDPYRLLFDSDAPVVQTWFLGRKL